MDGHHLPTRENEFFEKHVGKYAKGEVATNPSANKKTPCVAGGGSFESFWVIQVMPVLILHVFLRGLLAACIQPIPPEEKISLWAKMYWSHVKSNTFIFE